MSTVTEQQRNVAHARLTGQGAWNGFGLLQFLAETSRKDSLRGTLEPLRDLCESVRDSYDDGDPVTLSEDEAAVLDELIEYQDRYVAKLAAAPVPPAETPYLEQ